MRVHLTRCKGVAPATVPNMRTKNSGAARLASATRAQGMNVALASKSESMPDATASRRMYEGTQHHFAAASMPAIPEDVRTTSTQASWEELAPLAPVRAANSCGASSSTAPFLSRTRLLLTLSQLRSRGKSAPATPVCAASSAVPLNQEATEPLPAFLPVARRRNDGTGQPPPTGNNAHVCVVQLFSGSAPQMVFFPNS